MACLLAYCAPPLLCGGLDPHYGRLGTQGSNSGMMCVHLALDSFHGKDEVLRVRLLGLVTCRTEDRVGRPYHQSCIPAITLP